MQYVDTFGYKNAEMTIIFCNGKNILKRWIQGFFTYHFYDNGTFRPIVLKVDRVFLVFPAKNQKFGYC